MDKHWVNAYRARLTQCLLEGEREMTKIGFDNDQYLKMQSARIMERIEKFDNKLYLEFGGKLFDDFHAARVLPGFAPDSKIRMLLNLKDMAEIVIVISAEDIEKNKIRKCGFGREAVTHLCKHTLYFFSVAHVLLTAEAVDVCQRHLLTLCVYRFYFFYIFLLNKQFFLVYLFSQAVSPFLIQSPVSKTVYHNRL